MSITDDVVTSRRHRPGWSLDEPDCSPGRPHQWITDGPPRGSWVMGTSRYAAVTKTGVGSSPGKSQRTRFRALGSACRVHRCGTSHPPRPGTAVRCHLAKTPARRESTIRHSHPQGARCPGIREPFARRRPCPRRPSVSPAPIASICAADQRKHSVTTAGVPRTARYPPTPVLLRQIRLTNDWAGPVGAGNRCRNRRTSRGPGSEPGLSASAYGPLREGLVGPEDRRMRTWTRAATSPLDTIAVILRR